MSKSGVKRLVTMPDADGVWRAADSTPPRHKTQLPSDDSRSLCCEVDASSWVQPSGQQMPSIAFRDANTTKIAAATSLRTTLIILRSGLPERLGRDKMKADMAAESTRGRNNGRTTDRLHVDA